MTHTVYIWSHQLHVLVSRTFLAPFNVCANLGEGKKKSAGEKTETVCLGAEE